ncbi:hypothetical protein MBLNU457_g0860t1 [Dothideomycetes sp. NU457]
MDDRDYARSPPGRMSGYDRDVYGRTRERRRSPVDDRRRGGRNRSRSPVQIDRYQPDRSRDDYYRGRDEPDRRRRRSSPQAHPSIDRYVPSEESANQRPLPVNQLRDPLLENTQVGFSYFSEWWRMEQDIKQAKERFKNGGRRPEPIKESREEQRAKIQAAYDQYKLDWNSKMAKLFVHAHKYDTWFRERYDLKIRDPLRQRVADFRKGLYSTWDGDLQNGVFDDFTAEGIYKSESNGSGGVVEREEGEASAATEVLAVSDLLPAKGADMRDPVASLPTLLIKTITPAVPREKIEEFCKEHLGEGDGGFKWLSLSDPNPGKKFHRLGWIMLNPADDDGMEDAPRESRDDENENGAAEESKPQKQPTIQEKALEAIDNKILQDPEKGDFTVHVGIHRPSDIPRKKALWDLFSAPERIDRDLDFAVRVVNKLDQELGMDSAVSRIEERVSDLAGKGYLQPPIVIKKVKAEDGDDDNMEEGEEGEEVEDEEVDDEEMLIKKKKLDLLVEYLRRVHNFCFYCVFETDSVHELQRKCAGGHLRRPRASLTTAAKEVARASANGDDFPAKKDSADEDGEVSPVEQRKTPKMSARNQLQKAYNWVKTYEEKLLQVLEPENVDLKKLGGRPLEEGLEEELSKHVKQEDESKYRCKAPECSKLFKGIPFWRKHVEKRHTEWYEKLKEDIELVNRYVLDPARLAQGRNDASSNGHFPINQNMMGGTPRNFSLNGMPFGGNGMMGSNPPMFNTMMDSYPMQMPGWSGPGGDSAAGPMRTGGMRSSNRPPMDHGARRSISGRLSPPRGGPSRGRPSFVEGGVGTFGTSQAVEGRTMKSYNDLDAAGGAEGGGALDY